MACLLIWLISELGYNIGMKDITTLDKEYIEARNNYDEAIATNDWSAADHYSREMNRLDKAIASFEDNHYVEIGYSTL